MARRRVDRRQPGLARPALLVFAAACGAPPSPPPGALTLDDVIAADLLAGEWTWHHVESDGGTSRHEREHWRFTLTAERVVLAGRYTRDVDVRALDDVPFVCAQRPHYQLHADHEVTARIVRGGARIEEGAYQTRPSPCDPGLRHVTTYDAELHRDRLVLRWDGGEATLVRPRVTVDPVSGPRPTPPAPAGRWTWATTSWTRAGLIQREDEDWELATSADGVLAGTYLRTTTVRSADGAPLACAGASSYRYLDRYLVRGQRDDDGWRLEEVGAQAGEHPCLAATPTRTRDAATGAIEGDYLVLHWRGKRRQVLARSWVDRID